MIPIYIILTQSRSIVARAIKTATKKTYNHCSIAFDYRLPEMYSMGRIYPNNPLLGGLVIEKINQGTYKKFDDTVCEILEIYLDESKVKLMQKQLRKMLKEQRNYKYNYIGLLIGAAGITYQSENRFYCSEFVRYILNAGGVNTDFMPMVIQPTDFYKFDNYKVVYHGLLKEAKIPKPLKVSNKEVVSV